MADEGSIQDNSKFDAHMEEFQNRVPDTALWYETDVLRDHPEGWGVTVVVGGRLISGQVASTERWITAIREGAGLAADHPVSVGISLIQEQLTEMRATREAIERLMEEQGNDVELTVDQKIDLVGFSGFLHLINARVLTDGQAGLVPGQGVAMRLRYSEIQGWSLGTLGVGKN